MSPEHLHSIVCVIIDSWILICGDNFISKCVFLSLSCCWYLFIFCFSFFVFLSLQECYDNKPRIISKRFKDNQTICSNLDARHTFDANKWACLQHMSHSSTHPHPFLSHAGSLTLSSFSPSWTHFDICLCARQVLGICGEDPQCELQKGPSTERPVPLRLVPRRHPVRLQERRQLPLCPLRHRAQNLEGAARHRCPLIRPDCLFKQDQV